MLAAYYCLHDIRPTLGLALGEEIRYSTWLRGPGMDTAFRALAALATLATLATLEFDDRNYKVSVPRDILAVLDVRKIELGALGDEGVVKRVNVEGDLATDVDLALVFDAQARKRMLCAFGGGGDS